MFFSYIKIALRNLQKHKGYAFINIFGLAIGITASLLILQFVQYELSYDTFHEHGENIYRVRYDSYSQGERQFKSATAFPRVGPAMQADFPEVEAYSRLFLRYGGGVVRYNDVSFKEDNVFQAEQSFLTLFSYPMLLGDRNTALQEPNTAVISEETARKYFGNDNPVGERFRFGNQEEYEITGVIESPEQSHLKFTFLLSYPTLVQQWGEGFDNAWGWYDFYTYIKLHPEANPDELEASLPAFINRQTGEDDSSEFTTFILQPLLDIHLHSDLIQEARVNGDGTATYFLLIIALFILVIAWVNYINLSTARAVERAREIGVRKAVGAHKQQLVWQFILESFLVNIMAVVIAAALFLVSILFFNSLVGKALPFVPTGSALFWLGMIAAFIAGAILSGLYPAFVLSSYKPVMVLKGKFANLSQGINLRKALVVTQFVASVGLIAGTMIVSDQLEFMQNQQLGINIEKTLVINGPGVIANDSLYSEEYGGFKQALLQNSHITSVASSTEIPGNLIYWTNGSRRIGSAPESGAIMYMVGIDYDYLDGYGHQLIAGRGYSKDFTADQHSVVLNETAINVFDFGTPSDAIGQQIRIGGDTLNVVGVVGDYHQEGLQKAYDQIAFLLRPDARSYYSLKINTSDIGTVLGETRAAYAQFFPDNPFNYFFLDEFFDQQYQSQEQFGDVFGFFAMLAILVAMLGLFGLSSFTVAQRTKEIGIRKVLGSSLSNILLILTKDFLKLVAIASVIATPVVWFLMNRWLTGFAFRIDVSIWTFCIATLLTFVIALMTVGYQSTKAALANPVKSLRYE